MRYDSVASSYHFLGKGADFLNVQRDTQYIIIKRWIPEHDQELLFEHTAKLREKKMLEDTTVELRKERGKLKIVEKKGGRSRSRSRSWMFT